MRVDSVALLNRLSHGGFQRAGEVKLGIEIARVGVVDDAD